MKFTTVLASASALLLATAVASSPLGSTDNDDDAHIERALAAPPTTQRCPGGKTGILRPKTGQAVCEGVPFQFIFCSNIKNPANTLGLMIAHGNDLLLVQNLPPTNGRIYNTTLTIPRLHDEERIMAYEVRADGSRTRKTLYPWRVDVQPTFR